MLDNQPKLTKPIKGLAAMGLILLGLLFWEVFFNRDKVDVSILNRNYSESNNIDYSEIKKSLEILRWKAADEETRSLILKVANRQKEGWLDITSVQEFPCDVIMEIDRLWMNHSGGKFGFSIQNKIYLQCGGTPDGIYDEKAWKCFTKRVGWEVKNQRIQSEEVKFNTSAPLGHLPLVGFWDQGNRDVASLLPLSRIKICK